MRGMESARRMLQCSASAERAFTWSLRRRSRATPRTPPCPCEWLCARSGSLCARTYACEHTCSTLTCCSHLRRFVCGYRACVMGGRVWRAHVPAALVTERHDVVVRVSLDGELHTTCAGGYGGRYPTCPTRARGLCMRSVGLNVLSRPAHAGRGCCAQTWSSSPRHRCRCRESRSRRSYARGRTP